MWSGLADKLRRNAAKAMRIIQFILSLVVTLLGIYVICILYSHRNLKLASKIYVYIIIPIGIFILSLDLSGFFRKN